MPRPGATQSARASWISGFHLGKIWATNQVLSDASVSRIPTVAPPKPRWPKGSHAGGAVRRPAPHPLCILPRSLHRPLASTEGSVTRKVNKTGGAAADRMLPDDAPLPCDFRRGQVMTRRPLGSYETPGRSLPLTKHHSSAR